MHQIAEYGIAAHWKYKQNGQGAGSRTTYEWVRTSGKSGKLRRRGIYPQFESGYVCRRGVRVHPQRRRGEPARRRHPIDFAYSIHSAVGNSMVSCKVNNRIVTFDYPLQNGDIVEVVTSKAAHGPSRDWMNIAKSSEARNKIRQWFKKEKREENVAQGQAEL